jgi:hypothetical protein
VHLSRIRRESLNSTVLQFALAPPDFLQQRRMLALPLLAAGFGAKLSSVVDGWLR